MASYAYAQQPSVELQLCHCLCSLKGECRTAQAYGDQPSRFKRVGRRLIGKRNVGLQQRERGHALRKCQHISSACTAWVFTSAAKPPRLCLRFSSCSDTTLLPGWPPGFKLRENDPERQASTLPKAESLLRTPALLRQDRPTEGSQGMYQNHCHLRPEQIQALCVRRTTARHCYNTVDARCMSTCCDSSL